MIKLKDILKESTKSSSSPGTKGYTGFLPSEIWDKYKRKLNDSIKRTTGYSIVGLDKIPPDTIKKTDNPINKKNVSDKNISEMIKLKDLLFEGHNDSDDTGGVLYYWNDKVLLCLGSRSGEWNVPKGHIQIGEEPLDGSVREFTEETQIVLNGIPELANIYKKDSGGEFYLYVLKGTTKFIPRIDHEHSDWGYFDVSNLPSPIKDWVKETIEDD